MRLYFKQKFFSWLDSFEIFDEEGNVEYEVRSKLSWGHVLKIYNKYGEEVGTVKQVIMTLLPKYEFYRGSNYIGSMKKELTFFKPKYNMDFNGWHIDGDMWGWDYSITNAQGDCVVTVTKEPFHLTDRYNIDVVDEKDALTALMFVLAIDAEKCCAAASVSATTN